MKRKGLHSIVPRLGRHKLIAGHLSPNNKKCPTPHCHKDRMTQDKKPHKTSSRFQKIGLFQKLNDGVALYPYGGVLVISVHLLSLSVYSFFYPLHFIQQGVDLKLHHILRHLRKQEGHGVWNCLVDHHHGQGEVAK